MNTILIVDDNENIRKLVDIYLKREGFNTFHAGDGEEALDVIDRHKIDLIVLDIMMPIMDGYELTKELRDSGYIIPILMVTAKDTYPDKKQGFDLGIDDYITKPIDMEELVLRVKALLRRARIYEDKKLYVNDIVLDYDSLEVITPTQEISLPKKEFYLLYKLLSFPKKIFTRQDLLDDIWGYDAEVDERTVDVHIKRLREKFKDFDQFEIVTVRGLGYKGVY
ncbi:response regulator transcription factor [Tissierella sp. Yu-01]|uniref:response regulator transcription factor n=1 Tax=Tissierella sp. Yu-01 TaxID=3035694 RepID=UPI00240E87D1|nr:response regulator transcription factor [Tissierella sp. Yu-01]WFA08236.1 response regulator transcription factor [Tissierella sp. Yu-01]